MKHSVYQQKLSNDSELSVIKVPDSSIIEARFYFAAGFEYFTPDTFHVPHILEHLLVGNGKKFKGDHEFLRAIQELGANINASTDYKHVTVTIYAPRDTFDEVFAIAIDGIFNIRFSQEVLEEQKQVIIREINEQYDSLGVQAVNVALSKMFPAVVSQHWESYLGTVRGLDMAHIKTAYTQYIRPDNMHAIIAGNVSDKQMKSIEKSIELLERPKERLSVRPTINDSEGRTSIDGLYIKGNGAITFLFHSKDDGKMSHRDRVARLFTLMLLVGAPTAILPFRLRQKGMVYSIDSDTITLSNDRVEILSAMTEESKTHEAAIEILRSLRLYAAGHIPKAEFESVKKYVVNVLSVGMETVGDLFSWYESDMLNHRDLQTVEQEIAMVKALEIDDAARMTRTLFIDVDLYGLVASESAPGWSDLIAELHTTTNDIRSESEIENQMELQLRELSYERERFSKIRGRGWALYHMFNFVALATALYVGVLAINGNLLSYFDFAYDINHLWGFMFFVPFMLGGLLTSLSKGKREIVLTQAGVVLNAIAACVFIYGTFKYFGDNRIPHANWYQIATMVAQGFFFFAISPIAFFAVCSQFVKSFPGRKSAV